MVKEVEVFNVITIYNRSVIRAKTPVILAMVSNKERYIISKIKR